MISTLEQYARDVQSRIEFRDESASHSEAGDEIVEEQRFLSLHVVPEAQTVERKLRNYDHIPPIRLADAEWPLFLAIYESRVTGLTTAQADAAFGSGGVSRRQAVTRLRKGIGVLGITIPDRQFRLAEKSPHES